MFYRGRCEELNLSQVDKYMKVGVTAGASVPDWIIGEVIGKMSEINPEVNNQEIEIAETAVPAEAAAVEASVQNTEETAAGKFRAVRFGISRFGGIEGGRGERFV